MGANLNKKGVNSSFFAKKIRKKYKNWRFFCLFDLFSVKKRGCLSYKKHLSLSSLGRVSICCCFPSFLQTLSSDCTEPSARRMPICPLIFLTLSFGSTETPSPQRNYSEPSLSQRRALAVSITKARQLVESKGTPQSIHKCGSDNTLKRFSQSTKALR